MKNILYNRQHVKEYLFHGMIAAIAFTIPVWIFFFYLDYNQTALIFLGSLFFMFAIMWYVIKLSRRRPEYKSSWMMIMAAHFAVLIGIVLSVLLCVVLCFVYIPGFMSGNSANVLEDSPAGMNDQNWGLLSILFVCATVQNFGAGGFIAVLGPYVFKKNQMKDKTAVLDPEVNPTKA